MTHLHNCCPTCFAGELRWAPHLRNNVTTSIRSFSTASINGVLSKLNEHENK